ncbi:MAG: T9SS type A sorting domain-containing protein [Clostridiales bacterium]|nr:T9SS type A sorting domain-containing protein [Clostridiales bacterium]
MAKSKGALRAVTTYEVVITDSIGCQTTDGCKVFVTPSGIPPDNLNGDYLQIYPNPSNGIVNLTITHFKYNHSVLELFSAEGKLVKEVLVSTPVLTIDPSDLGQGIYIYNWIVSDETAESGKLL